MDWPGDTLASALLANGVDVICPSPILGRPRGVFSAGVEEPCAFVEITSPRSDPIAPATAVELVEGLTAVGRPGVGRLPDDDAGVAPADHRHLHVETLVVGGGLAGLKEAREAAAAGDRVLLVDERHWLGGLAHTTDTVDGDPALSWVEGVVGELDAAPDVRVMTRATALGVYDMGYVVVYERSRPVERVWHVRAGRVILATGAHERPVAFADDDRPGVMLASAAALYADRFGVLPGSRAVVFTTNHTGHRAAMRLADAGLEVVALIDAGEGGPATEETRGRGIDVRSAWSVTGTDGDPRVRAVQAWGPTAPPTPSLPTCSSWRAAGTRRSSCGAASTVASATTRRMPASSPTATRLTGCGSWAPPPGMAFPPSRHDGSPLPTISAGISSTSSATRPSRTCSRPSG